MLPQKPDNNEVQAMSFGTDFKIAFKALSFLSCIHRAGFVKRSGLSVSACLQMLLMIPFGFGTTVYRFCTGKHFPKGKISKSALYEFLGNASFNWRKLLNLLAVRFIAGTEGAKTNCLIVDSSCLYRNRSKYTEMLSYCYDHAKGASYKGFQLISLAWTDGISCIPVDFSLSASKKRVCKERDDSVKKDRRTLSYRRRQEAESSKTDVVKSMVKRALAQGVPADYLLFDSWFCYHSFIQDIYSFGIHIICMLKDMRCNTYRLHKDVGESLTLKQLIGQFSRNKPTCYGNIDIYGSVIVYTKTGLKVKTVFVCYKETGSRIVALCSTDTTLTEEEICALYAERWKIECMFKVEKQKLGLEKDCRARKFDVIWAHVAIVQIRVILSEQIRRTAGNSQSTDELIYEQSEENRCIRAVTSVTECYLNCIAYIRTKLQKTVPLTKQTDEVLAAVRYSFLLIYRCLPDTYRKVIHKEKCYQRNLRLGVQ